ncbi:MAG: DUF6597 domain-containing transcriptional factor [Gemmatimonadaceae bacterium]
MPNAQSSLLPTEYREWAPPPVLAHAVTCVWTRGTQAPGSTGPRTVLPDNSVDLLWRFDEDGTLHDAAVIGPMSRPLTIPDDHDTQYVGVRFKPGYAAVVLQQEVGELRDARVDLDTLLPGAQHWLEGPGGLDVRAVGDRLQRTLGRSVPDALPPTAIQHALEVVHQTRGAVPVESLAQTVGVTRQHLARLFETHIGLRPKLVARVLRLQHVMTLAARAARVASARATGQAARVSWSALALEAGYTDQPHLIADFISLAGVTPSQWLAER